MSIDRITKKIDFEGSSGCWIWKGASSNGYGHVRVNYKLYTAHRYIYIQINGPIPDNLDVDHLCRNKLCVNPAHLEAVTRKENSRRGLRPGPDPLKRMQCKHGHKLDDKNTYWYLGLKKCRACRYKAQRKYIGAKRNAACIGRI